MEDRVRLKRVGLPYRGKDFDGTVFDTAAGEAFECSARLAGVLLNLTSGGFEVVGATGDGSASGAGASGEGPASTTAGLEAGATTGTPASTGSESESGTGSAPAPARKRRKAAR